jgi:hypothetical protein
MTVAQSIQCEGKFMDDVEQRIHCVALQNFSSLVLGECVGATAEQHGTVFLGQL